jgi:hypothetical protein
MFPINAGGATIGPAHYSSLNVSLVADVGYDDGTLSTNAAGIGFSNPVGTANDVTLATGVLLAASLSLDAQGARHAHYLTTFTPSAGEAAFFVGPIASLDWEEFLTTPAVAFSVTQVDPNTLINVVEGDNGSGGNAQLVPEPASVMVLGGGLVCVRLLRRRRRD